MSALPAVSGSPDARLQAAGILLRVDRDRAHAARLLGAALPLTRELVLGSLRWQGTLDLLLSRHLRQPLRRLEPPLRAVLRIGLFEAQQLDTPVPVAVSEAVRVAGRMHRRGAGLVNAVLRRAAAERWPDPDDETLPLSERFAHPDWLVHRWQRLLGEELCRRALESDQRPAPLALYAPASDPAELSALGVSVGPHPYVDGSVTVEGGADRAVAAIRSGRAYAMDPHAVLVARMLPEQARRVVDLAAAPGGKALVTVRERPSVWLAALDRSPRRLRLMQGNLGAFPVPLVAADGRRPPLLDAAVDAVVLDAPCSGTGTLRRHPEIRWRLQPEALGAMAELQRELLAAAAALVRPGGWVLYSTCSLEPEENAAVAASSGLTAVSPAGGIPSGARAVELDSGGVVLPPGPEGDGFTVHLMRR